MFGMSQKCCHIWLNQNFDPSLLTNELWLVFNFYLFFWKIKWPTQKNWDFQNRQFSIFFFIKILIKLNKTWFFTTDLALWFPFVYIESYWDNSWFIQKRSAILALTVAKMWINVIKEVCYNLQSMLFLW